MQRTIDSDNVALAQHLLQAFDTATATTCQAETREIKEISVGVWQDIYKGSYGRAVLGAQGSYAVRHAFPGSGGAPSSNVGMLLASLRYYPFPP